MARLKVAVIGGGSSYTPELIEGFIKRQDELPVRELWLVDIEPGCERLAIIGGLAARMVAKAGASIEIHTTLNRREALQDADFVTTQLRVGFLDARIKDERIPLRHGCMGQETNGAGGMFQALRTIPVMLDIAQDMSELCPDAWMINFTNPSGMITEALLRYGKTKKIIGLCNLPIGMERAIAGLLGADPDRVRIDFAGLNHMVFGLNVYLDGFKVTNQIIARIGNGEMESMLQNFGNFAWSSHFIAGLGVIPCSYHKYYFQKQEMLEKELEEFAKGETRAEKVQKLERELFELYQDPNLDMKPPQLAERGGAYYSEAACRLISSIYNDKKDIQAVDTQNYHAITGLPADSAVEVSCVITRNGPQPIAMGELPVAVGGLVQQIKSFERTVIEAAVTGDYNTALVAMTINPLVQSEKMARILLDELLEAHRDYLPRFQQYFSK